MNKVELETELKKLMEQVTTIKERSEIERRTADFLANECNKIMIKANNPKLGYTEKEKVSKQMEALIKRMEFEVHHIHDDDAEMDRIGKRIEELSELWASGKIQD